MYKAEAVINVTLKFSKTFEKFEDAIEAVLSLLRDDLLDVIRSNIFDVSVESTKCEYIHVDIGEGKDNLQRKNRGDAL